MGFVQKEALKLKRILCCSPPPPSFFFPGGFYVLKIGVGEKLHSCPALAVGPVCLSAVFWYQE